MKPNDETIEAYKKMAKESSGADMKAQIQENLSRTCDKFAGNEDKLDRCIRYLTDCAREILGCKNGDVPDEVCFRICRDYFNDEIWKKEDEEEAKKKAEREKLEAKRKEKADAAAAEKARKKAEAEEARKKALEEKKAALEAKRAAKDAEKARKKEAEKSVPEQVDMFAMMEV